MTLAEEDIIVGNGAQTSGNRWGDYGQMTLDPTDDATFWYTGEYIFNGRKSRVASFKIANDADDDIENKNESPAKIAMGVKMSKPLRVKRKIAGILRALLKILSLVSSSKVACYVEVIVLHLYYN